MASPQDVKLRIVAENLARAALQEAKKDVQGVGQAAGTAAPPFANLVRYFDQGNRTGTLFRNALQQLSFHAAEIPGPIGKAGSAILGLGVSGGPILIATAALGIFALAWKKAGEAGELAASNAESAGERIRKVFASALQGGNTEEFGQRIALFRTRLEEARQALRSLESQESLYTPEHFAEEHAGAVTRVNQAQALLAQAQDRARDAAERATASLERQADALEATNTIRRRAVTTGEDEKNTLVEIAAATARVQAATLGLDAAHTQALVTANVRLERLREENRVLEAQRDLLADLAQIQSDINAALPGILQALAGIPGFEFPQDVKARDITGRGVGRKGQLQLEAGGALPLSFFDAPKTALKGALVDGGQKAAIVMAQAFVTGVGQFRQGGAAGVIGGLGSLATGASALKNAPAFLGPAGFALSAVSTLVSLFGNEQTRLLKEQLAELRKLNARPIFQPRAPTNVFVGSGNSPAETAYLVGRRGDRDAVNRMGEDA